MKADRHITPNIKIMNTKKKRKRRSKEELWNSVCFSLGFGYFQSMARLSVTQRGSQTYNTELKIARFFRRACIRYGKYTKQVVVDGKGGVIVVVKRG